MLKKYKVEVTAVDRAGKLEQLRSLGYDHVIEYPEVDFTRTGKQYDFILDARTSKSVFDYLRALKPGGIYATVGGDRIFRFMFTAPFINPFVKKRLKLVSLRANKNLTYINELIESGEIRPVIDRVFEFTEIHEALSRFLRAEHFGKVVIRMESPWPASVE
ncbi:MAG: zinc-binding dehydrogenase [Pseudohongiellaceae bacterium]